MHADVSTEMTKYMVKKAFAFRKGEMPSDPLIITARHENTFEVIGMFSENTSTIRYDEVVFEEAVFYDLAPVVVSSQKFTDLLNGD